MGMRLPSAMDRSSALLAYSLRIISEPERMKDRRQKPVNAFAGCTVHTAGSSRITANQGYQYGSGMLILVQVGRNLK
jgi:hypothetical protein